jgi:succinate dehydrogenase flavin-adding protein (antitoxin of CptAB toxin-antitoxin module)
MSEADRLRWRCRRGMLELDLVLARFLDEQYPHLSPSEQRAFESLLDTPDDALLQMITGDTLVAEPRLRPLVERLRLC